MRYILTPAGPCWVGAREGKSNDARSGAVPYRPRTRDWWPGPPAAGSYTGDLTHVTRNTMSGSSKQGVRPAQMYSHTLPSHHPGRHPPNSGSSHPDTRGRGRTATPRHPAPTQPLRRCAKPTPVVDSRLLLFIIPLASHHPARRRSRPASNTRRHAGVVWRPRVRRPFCKTSARQREDG